MRISLRNKIQFNNMFFKHENKNNIISGITIDSRLVKNGDMFVAMKGDKSDGHLFINNALKLGASLIVSEKKQISSSTNFKLVKSSNEFLNETALNWRKSFSGNVIGITGSNGKTTTKELLATIFSSKKDCEYTQGNFNSTTGVPLSILGMDNNADIFIIEIGMSKPDEIKNLCNISLPNIALITNVSGAHIKNFKSIKNIAQEKSSLFKCLNKNDTAFYNIDDNYIPQFKTNAKKISFSLKNKANYTGKLKSSSLLINNSSKINLPYENLAFAYNAIASFAISHYLGMDEKDIIQKIESYKILSGRGNVFESKGCIIIDDTYNSNLESAKNGILQLKSYNENHRTIAILGDMFDLGEKSIPFHCELGEFILSNKINNVFGIGEFTKNTIDIINANEEIGFHFNSKEKLSKELSKFINTNDVLYFKASRGMKLEKIIFEVFK